MTHQQSNNLLPVCYNHVGNNLFNKQATNRQQTGDGRRETGDQLLLRSSCQALPGLAFGGEPPNFEAAGHVNRHRALNPSPIRNHRQATKMRFTSENTETSGFSSPMSPAHDQETNRP